MPRDLDTWARDLPADLRRVPSLINDELQAQRAAVLARIRRRLPRSTGDLAASYEARMEGTDLVVASDDRAAEAAERGTPEHGSPWLAVPLHDSLRRLSGPRADGSLVAIRTRDGRVFLGRGSGGTLELRWRLTRSVRAPRTGAGAVRAAVLETLKVAADHLGDSVARAVTR